MLAKLTNQLTTKAYYLASFNLLQVNLMSYARHEVNMSNSYVIKLSIQGKKKTPLTPQQLSLATVSQVVM